LNSSARHSNGFDVLQFRVEEQDEINAARRIDLVPAPCGVAIIVEGRRYVDFESLLPIECKRLPTPSESNRDQREYVFSQYSTTGGIQRFKAGHHGGAHCLGAMIGFVQDESVVIWHQRTIAWIRDLNNSGVSGWTQDDLLKLDHIDATLRVAVLQSRHDRGADLPAIELRHLWVEMT
jgi:hypothetical protein